MTPDPRWLAILKASGPQTLAVAIALGLFWLANRHGFIPPLAPWIVDLTVLGFLICACLTVVSFLVVVMRLGYVAIDTLISVKRAKR